MKIRLRRRSAGFTLLEMLTYIAVLAAILGVGGAALSRLWTASGHLRRETDDLRALLAAGERWREDVRGSAGAITSETFGTAQVVRLQPPQGAEIQWAFAEGAMLRRVGGTNDWTPLVRHVRASVIRPEPRGDIRAWCWDVELEPITRTSRFQRQISFFAVPTVAQP